MLTLSCGNALIGRVSTMVPAPEVAEFALGKAAQDRGHHCVARYREERRWPEGD
jgi:hypothetical protein